MSKGWSSGSPIPRTSRRATIKAGGSSAAAYPPRSSKVGTSLGLKREQPERQHIFSPSRRPLQPISQGERATSTFGSGSGVVCASCSTKPVS